MLPCKRTRRLDTERSLVSFLQPTSSSSEEEEEEERKRVCGLEANIRSTCYTRGFLVYIYICVCAQEARKRRPYSSLPSDLVVPRRDYCSLVSRRNVEKKKTKKNPTACREKGTEQNLGFFFRRQKKREKKEQLTSTAHFHSRM